MIRDPIIEEVRAIRDAIAEGHRYELSAIFAALQEIERKSGREHVTLPAKKFDAQSATRRTAAG